MKTPICDFVNNYAKSDAARLHMPGHKGVSVLGCESLDITEITGADELFAPDGIIAESERNASRLFGADTFYSAGGSTLCIQVMLYLLAADFCERRNGETCRFDLPDEPNASPLILAGRNAHKAFVNAAALLGIQPVRPEGHITAASSLRSMFALRLRPARAVLRRSMSQARIISEMFLILQVLPANAILPVFRLRWIMRTAHTFDFCRKAEPSSAIFRHFRCIRRKPVRIFAAIRRIKLCPC